MKIMVCLRQIGGANAVVPVARSLKESGNNVVFYSQGVAYQRFCSDLPLVSADSIEPDKALDWFSPDVVVSECVAPEENTIIPRRIVASAKGRGIFVVVVQDFWASGLSVVWESMPDIMCVQDKLAKELVEKAWPGIAGGRVVITGQPAFNHLRGVDCDDARNNLRAMYDLKEDWPIIHYSGGFKGIAESVACLLEALNQLQKPAYLFVRLHPRMTDPGASSEWKEEYRKYQELVPGLTHGKSVDTSDKRISDLVNAASDVVVGAFPTMIVEACYLRKACLSITNPAAQEYYEMETSGALKVFPPVALGCCYGAVNTEETVSAFDSIFSGFTLKDAQEEHFVSDGQSANRIANAILDRYGQ